ncbi:hypothetical protein SAMN06269301_1558 [Geobacter sp. DSM 9736]|nr:hypothetical protein SAMN06269301_1558 [Geobacter sp. DSM 9736]
MGGFRRRIGDSLWHWSTSCADWPKEQESVHLHEDEYPERRCPKCEASSLCRLPPSPAG